MPNKHAEKKKSETRHHDQQREPRRCVYCGTTAPLVWVHGHGQCANCGINVEECCRGEKE